MKAKEIETSPPPTPGASRTHAERGADEIRRRTGSETNQLLRLVGARTALAGGGPSSRLSSRLFGA